MDGLALWEGYMSQDEYRRLHAACLDMARQSIVPDVRARWLAMADVWRRRAIELGPVGVNERGAVGPRLH
jgi:hypothetical protein